MRPLLVFAILLCAILLCTSSVGAAGGVREQVEILTIRSAQAELRGRPSLDATVMGLVRRGEDVEFVRSSADRRWIQVEIGGGELAWLEAGALEPRAATPDPQRRDPLRPHRPSWTRADADRRSDKEGARQSEGRREEEVTTPPRGVHDEPREAHVDPLPPPKREPREAHTDPPVPAKPPPRVREEPHEVRTDPPPTKRESREQSPSTHLAERTLREIPPAKPGELFAADLDDERPPTSPGDTSKRVK